MARPFGSKNLPKLCDYLGKEKIDKLAEKAYEVAIKKGDATMLKFLLEQIYGKAPQPITGEDGNILQIQVIPYDKDGDKKDLPAQVSI